MRRTLVAVTGALALVAALATAGTPSARAATRAAALVSNCVTNLSPGGQPLWDDHTGNGAYDVSGWIEFQPEYTSTHQGFTNWCYQNLGGGEFEIMDTRTGGCMSVTASGMINWYVSEEDAAGCDINGNHGYVWDRWYVLTKSNDSSSGTYIEEFSNEDSPGGCLYGDTTVAEYVGCDTNTTGKDLAEWFVWGAVN
jgi:hypothetical protein